MERYSNIVRGQFYGHIHEDYFELVRSLLNPNEFINVVQVHPALTTLSGNNPSFRVYEVDKEKLDFLDYAQYRLWIDESNKKREPIWNVTFKFKEYYEVDSMQVKDFEKALQKMKIDRTYLTKVYQAHYTNGPKANVPSDEKSLNYMFCRYSSGNFYEFEKCVQGKYMGGDFGRLYIAGTLLFPDWRIAIPNPK